MWRGGDRLADRQFFMRLAAAFVPIDPAEFPGFAGIELMGLGPKIVECLEIALRKGGFTPFDFGFDQIEEVLGKAGCRG